LGGSSVLIDLEVSDVALAYADAVAAGATPVRAPDLPEAGLQAAKVRDPFGHVWLLTHTVR
jgi:uncharacterized glyoxalase superfamily protein PhnB